MMLPHAATVLVVDGEALRVLRNHGDERGLDLREEDRPKLVPAHGSGGMRHHNSSANPDRARLAEDDFAATVADWLNRRTIDSASETLVVVATPKTLGELRRLYHKTVEEKLLAEIPREMTDATVAAIATLVREH